MVTILPALGSYGSITLTCVLCATLSMLLYSQDRQKYTVLLIITDGMINDMEATKVTPQTICGT